MQRELDMQTTQDTEIFVAALTAQADSLTLRLHALQPDEFQKRYRDLLRRIETDEFIPSIEVLEKENPLSYLIQEINYPGSQIDLDGRIINFDDGFALLETACFYIKHLTPEYKKIEWLSVAWFDTFGFGGVDEEKSKTSAVSKPTSGRPKGLFGGFEVDELERDQSGPYEGSARSLRGEVAAAQRERKARLIYPPLTEQHILKAVEANYLSFNWADGDYEKYSEEMTGIEKPVHSKCIGYYSFNISEQVDDTDDSFWKFELHFIFNETNKDWEFDSSECVESS
jgi:hypothetical protein